jgi:capsular polysaccharide biosynthesis protein
MYNEKKLTSKGKIMEISIKDIVKAVIKRWYIMLASISVLTAIGTGVGIKDYKTPTYTASSSYFFEISSSNVSLYISTFKAYLETTNVDYQIQNKINEDYNVTITTSSAILSITVTASSEEVATAVLNEYEAIITDTENKLRSPDLIIEPLFDIEARPVSPNLNSLIIKILLFMIIGAFLGGVIILVPLYNDKIKEEKLRLGELEKPKGDLDNNEIKLKV